MSETTDDMQALSPLQRALITIKEMRARLEAADQARREPIAVIGLGCRLPGGANTPQAFWQLLHDGVDAITEVPADRWNATALYDADMLEPGKMNSRYGGFLERVEQFDAPFFGISPREAAHMDPQQRLLLETSYEALENAGQPLTQLDGSATAVFVGIHSHSSDYAWLQFNDLGGIDMHTSTGTAHSIVANRLSYFFNWQGPSLAVDTACSSSLVAVHLACLSLRNRECDLALAGGVNLMLAPEMSVSLSKMQALSPDGRCRTFDAGANGFVRGEGCGVVILKRLSDALAAGDTVLALIAGSAVNQDGASNGLTAPNSLSQQAVIRQALQNAGVEPAQISYVETHGTGTVLGDPIEVEALTAVIGQPRPNGDGCALGSVKTNIGHLEGAAGIAGLIKLVLALQHEAIPPHLHLQQLNPHISFDNTPFFVPTQVQPWPAGTGRTAGLSSFGFGGTNAHLIVTESGRQLTVNSGQLTVNSGQLTVNSGQLTVNCEQLTVNSEQTAVHNSQLFLLPLSARSSDALADLAGSYAQYLSDNPPSLVDVCYTASLRRTHHAHRLGVLGSSAGEMAARLRTLAGDETDPELTTGHALPANRRGLVFVFSGQGSELTGMGRELLAEEPLFRATIEACDELLRRYVPWSLLEELTADPPHSRLDQNDVAQPALFAVQIALAALWRSWGVTPDAVIGHSVGEVAAAHVAGVLDLADAIRVIFHRGRVIQKATGLGSMAAVGLSPAEAEARLAAYNGRLSLAVVNSPTSTVLSGETEALAELVQVLQAENKFGRLLHVNYPSHSHLMEPFRRELVQALSAIRPRPATIPIYATVSGGPGQNGDFDAAYWGRNMCQPVLFAPALTALARAEYATYLELGAHPLLATPIAQCVASAAEVEHGLAGSAAEALTSIGADQDGRSSGEAAVLASLHRQQPARASMLRALAALYTQGYPLNWNAFYPDGGRQVDLPAYPWQHRRYWLHTANKADSSGQKAEKATASFSLHSSSFSHPLLGRRLHAPHPIFETVLSLDRQPFLGDHRFHDLALLPATAFLEMVLAAAAAGPGLGPYQLSEVAIEQALLLPESDEGVKTVQTLLTPDGMGAARFQIFSLDGESETEWTQHAVGVVGRVNEAALTAESISLAEIQNRCQQVEPVDHYRQLAQQTLVFGDSFRGIRQLWQGQDEALAQIQMPESCRAEAANYTIHPAFLDACLQPLAAAVRSAGPAAVTYVLIGIEQATIGPLPPTVWSHAQLRPSANGQSDLRTGDVSLYDENGRLLARFNGVLLKQADAAAIRRLRPAAVQWPDWLYDVIWQPQPLSTAQPLEQPGHWLILAEAASGQALSDLLQEAGQTAVLVTPGDTYRKVTETQWQISASEPADFDRLLSEAVPDELPLRGVVYLWGEAAPTAVAGDLNAGQAAEIQQHIMGGALHLTQALIRANLPGLPRLWFVTCKAQAVTQKERQTANEEPLHDASLWQAALWGFGRVLALEHPDLWGGLVDLDGDAAAQAANLLAELQAGMAAAEDQIAWRGGRRYVARLQKAGDNGTFLEKQAKLSAAFSPGPSSFLISGGLGGLGLKVAGWLAEQGVTHLVLTGRTGLPPREAWAALPPDSEAARRVAGVQAVEAAGATVTAVAVDVADEAEMGQLWSRFGRVLPPLRGVIHMAAAIDAAPLATMSLETLQAMFRAKVQGAWLLHRLTQEMAELDCFVLFSSTTALWGVSGMAHYAAANCFLDALAHYRRERGLPVLSLNWGLWDEQRVFSSEEQTETARYGLEMMPADQALAAMNYLLAAGVSQKVVAAVDWSVLKPAYESRGQRPFFTLLEERTKRREPTTHQTGAAVLSQQLAALSAGERYDFLLDTIRGLVNSVMGYNAGQWVDVQQGLFNVGMDSLMAVELKSRLEKQVGQRLPAGLIFNYPTIKALTDYLATQILALAAPDPLPATDLDEAAGLDRHEDVSEDELFSLFDEELAAIEEMDL